MPTRYPESNHMHERELGFGLIRLEPRYSNRSRIRNRESRHRHRGSRNLSTRSHDEGMVDIWFNCDQPSQSARAVYSFAVFC
ncbi:hypothetical protein ACO22_02041 [Paracoccidioides brasiliensis]|uniref:Uncharacterized protein n=1 Tax=Paracoccidioides brasiliensis TaxID=121759 RepID=A0A1D2JJU0_PARBR|nr:hypothetical protein ACO22_02041 [Paracoccidioides brasiliensis]ODH52049.1 hypothetical protein GX48_01838 [Paracoccidioides brasiliensis]